MALIDIQLHTQTPARMAELKEKLSASGLAEAKLMVAELLKNLTQERFSAQADPWGNPWKPSQRALGYPLLHARHARAMERYRERKRRYDDLAREAKAKAKGKGKGKAKAKAKDLPDPPRKPKPPPRGGGQTLRLTGRLMNSFEVRRKGDEVVITVAKSGGGGTARAGFAESGSISNLVYFPPHQFGYQPRKLVARPMMPLRPGGVDLPQEYVDEIRDVLKEWLKNFVS